MTQCYAIAECAETKVLTIKFTYVVPTSNHHYPLLFFFMGFESDINIKTDDSESRGQEEADD